ncbi:MAG: ParB/RepB/Spo0J family partition protein [Clostridia bacterium]|nr:ParB/RepB/Spo0J family partition protein [Clostridia bacterium]MBR6563889.1 ParB/RepB/Spo0J family partition protein [Clostridia bacterium]
MAIKKGGLGRGLDALFNENSTENGGVINVSLNDIEPNREQPRKDFDEEALSELAESIAEHGLIQPIVVKPETNGRYSIIAGERRWRACRIAGLYEVPVVIKDADPQELMELALIENLQREDLNAVEEALGYSSLIDSFALTQEQVAKRVGKSRAAVTNALRLLNLTDEELQALRMGAITAGHARALLSVEDEAVRRQMLELATNGASVRELEKMATKAKKGKASAKKAQAKPIFYSEVELSLKNELHRKVNITPTGDGKGKITIEFFSDEELSDFARRLAE